MICPNCQTINESVNIFCVNCGANVAQTGNVIGDTKAPTERFQYTPEQPPATEILQNSVPATQFAQNAANTPPPTQIYHTSNSVETSVVPVGQYGGAASIHNFAPAAAFPNTQTQPANNRKKMFVWAGVIFAGLLSAGLGGFFLLTKQVIKAEILPEYLGMFIQSKDKDKLDEIRRQDFTNALDGKDKLLKDDSLAGTESNPNLILYSDGKDIPLGDLRLIQLDTIKPDGSLKQIEFQVAPVEGKAEMKRIRISGGLANGKYAFAILNDFLDEGKHRFWAFQVKNSDKTNNDATLKAITITLKPKKEKSNTTTTTQTNTPVNPPPTGSYAYCKNNNVVLRSSPSLTASKVDGLYSGQRLYVMNISDNTTTWRGITGKWAYVETDNGNTGWVFAPLLRY